jgi:drug/metabolite transporter (DMT)-like permease
MGWYLLSGVVGFGLGDISLYFALPRLGARLSLLVTQCLAAPLASAIEWMWLGTHLTTAQILCAAGVLTGVLIALSPRDNPNLPQRDLLGGIGFGVLAAMGQAGGAVLSRKAYALSLASGVVVDGGTAAFQRIVGGVACGALGLYLLGRHETRDRPGWGTALLRSRQTQLTTLGAALCGPVLGVGCYQWALASAPSGLVLPIVALCPMVAIPFTWWLEGDRPTPRAIAGGAGAVAAAIALARIQAG